ncbi:MAG TPA: hypothetical protein PL029_01990, partial [Bacteroidia bacterium]|nr:hypothetical protein [Bacteroidia bacterium]
QEFKMGIRPTGVYVGIGLLIGIICLPAFVVNKKHEYLSPQINCYNPDYSQLPGSDKIFRLIVRILTNNEK